jgi:hypothetical protein
MLLLFAADSGHVSRYILHFLAAGEGFTVGLLQVGVYLAGDGLGGGEVAGA